MDMRTQEILANIETDLECLNPKWLSYSQRCELLETMQFLVDVVREQDEDIKKTNEYVSQLVDERNGLQERIVSLGEEIVDLKAKLAKYERVVEAAQHWRETQANGTWKMQGGSKEMFDMLQVKVARRQVLIDAVDDLKA